MKRILTIIFPLVASTLLSANSQLLKSPDGRLEITIRTGQEGLAYSLSDEGRILISESPISVTLSDGTKWDGKGRLSGVTRRSSDQTLASDIYRRALIRDKYNEMTLKYRGYSLVVRAYDNGVAWRFVSGLRSDYIVKEELASFVFPEDWEAYFSYVKQHTETLESQFYNSFENRYDHVKISQYRPDRLSFLPAMVEGPDGIKLCITESDLTVYPGMYLYNGDGSTTLKSVHAPYPKVTHQGDHINCQIVVDEREDYIARMTPSSRFPWRIVCVSREDKEMADNDLPWLLGAPANPETDFSWVKPGKVAWDWWNDWNLYGVDFKAGVNDETYKYYIDFAAANGIEYILLDEGWAVSGKADLFEVIPDIHIDELCRYGEQKGVGVILWAGYWAFARDMERVCKVYSEMGVKGFKVDFMDRDDQQMEQFYYDAAATAARYHLRIDFHGAHKPVGLHRTFPNVVGYEGVFGLENMKWVPDPNQEQVVYDVLLPYLRQLAGPMDYTQGAMRNASWGNYRPVHSEGMSQGTRCRQLAEYVVFESPFNMLCDSPSNYIAEPECTEFIARIPTVWDETIVLDGVVGKYIVTARRRGNDWYVGGMTDWSARDMEIDLSFLGEGNYAAELFKDGINAHKAGRDYKKLSPDVSSRKLAVHLAPGGGFALRLTPVK